MTTARAWRFAVFAERGKRVDWKIRCYSDIYNDRWAGFVGFYLALGSTRAEAIRAKKESVRKDLQRGVVWPREGPERR